jgi:hypothetical protein
MWPTEIRRTVTIIITSVLTEPRIVSLFRWMTDHKTDSPFYPPPLLVHSTLHTTNEAGECDPQATGYKGVIFGRVYCLWIPTLRGAAQSIVTHQGPRGILASSSRHNYYSFYLD